jgi:hypothetical protein
MVIHFDACCDFYACWFSGFDVIFVCWITINLIFEIKLAIAKVLGSGSISI